MEKKIKETYKAASVHKNRQLQRFGYSNIFGT